MTPNNGSLAFVPITLNLGSTTPTFSGGDIIPNGSQTDNVFVKVPSGSSLDDLQLNGSSAEVSGPVDDNTKFNLSHVCDGNGPGPSVTPVPGPTVAPEAVTVAPAFTG